MPFLEFLICSPRYIKWTICNLFAITGEEHMPEYILEHTYITYSYTCLLCMTSSEDSIVNID